MIFFAYFFPLDGELRCMFLESDILLESLFFGKDWIPCQKQRVVVQEEEDPRYLQEEVLGGDSRALHRTEILLLFLAEDCLGQCGE